MADPTVVATRRADALHRFDAEAAKLVASLGVKPPRTIDHEINRDAELRKVHDLERVVDFLKEVNESLAATAREKLQQKLREKELAEAEEQRKLAESKAAEEKAAKAKSAALPKSAPAAADPTKK